jgi:hypothetical protein
LQRSAVTAVLLRRNGWKAEMVIGAPGASLQISRMGRNW